MFYAKIYVCKGSHQKKSKIISQQTYAVIFRTSSKNILPKIYVCKLKVS